MIYDTFYQSYELLCTETTGSNPLVVFPKSICDIFVFRGLWFMRFEN